VGEFAIVNLLIHLNCQIGPKNQSSFIHAAENGRTDIVKLLIDANISPSAYSPALCSSVKRGHLKTVQHLINSNADPSTQNNLPLQYARDNQHPEIVTYLLNFPEVSKKSPPSTTPNTNPDPPTPTEAFVKASIGSVRTVQGKDRYTEYEILVKTNIPMLAKGKSSIMVHRRYSQFIKFFKVMNNYILSSTRYHKVLPTIGSEDYFSRFENEIIEKRKEKLQKFMDAICGDSQLRCVTHLVQFIDPCYEYPVK